MSTERVRRETLEVTIGAEGAAAAPATIEPAYMDMGREINGPGCGLCFTATATVTLH